MNPDPHPAPQEAAPDLLAAGSGPYALDYLDVPPRGEPASARATRVVALGGKGANELAALRRWLPGMEVMHPGDTDGLAARTLSDLGEGDRLFILAGLGGRRGSARAPALTQAARDRGIPAYALVSLPFAFETAERAARANAARQEVAENALACLAFDNQDLLTLFGGETDLSAAFAAHTRWLAHAVTTLDGWAEAARASGLLMDDRWNWTPRMGFGKASGADREREALAAALANPLLHGLRGGRALLALCSGDTPTVAAMRQASNLARDALDENCELTVWTWRDPRMGLDCYATLFLGE